MGEEEEEGEEGEAHGGWVRRDRKESSRSGYVVLWIQSEVKISTTC